MSNQSVNFEFGSVQYVSKIDPVPPSTRVEGNVTYNEIGSDGFPAYFKATFMLTCETQLGDTDKVMRNIFHWTEAMVGLARETPYSEVEAQAARQLAPSLRAVADQIEKLVAEFDQGKSAVKP